MRLKVDFIALVKFGGNFGRPAGTSLAGSTYLALCSSVCGLRDSCAASASRANFLRGDENRRWRCTAALWLSVEHRAGEFSLDGSTTERADVQVGFLASLFERLRQFEGTRIESKVMAILSLTCDGYDM